MAFHTRQRLVGDHRGSGVHESGRFLAGLRVLDGCEYALFGHLLRELHDCGRVQAILDVLDAFATAVDRTHDDLARQPARFQRRVRATSHRLVHRVDGVDVGGALEKVLHALLREALVAVRGRVPLDLR